MKLTGQERQENDMSCFRGRFIIGMCTLLTLLFSIAANADDYPSRPIRLLVGYGPGGAVDIVSRIIADQLQNRFAQRIVVENRPGGGTTIALGALAQGAPDGYTLMMADIGYSAAPALRADLPYDTFKDFVPVVLVALLPGVMAVDAKLPVKSVDDFVKLAKSEPGKLNYASSGLGSLGHLGPELFKTETHTDIVQIPYQSGAQATQALLRGDAQMLFATAPPLLPFADKMRILAISHDKRLPIMPNVPTFAELGQPGVQIELWEGVFAPRGTDKKIIAKLNADINAVLQMPEVSQRIAKLGGDVVGGTPERLGQFAKAEVAKWLRVLPASLRSNNK
jgi:tripartite-type tricarboxylate transporter receptor subunit TctC